MGNARLFHLGIAIFAFVTPMHGDSASGADGDLRVAAAAVNLQADGTMVLGGSIQARYSDQQEGELRAVAVVVEKPGETKLAIVACDVLWIPRYLVDEAVEEINEATGIPPSHILVNATHTHSAPSTAPAHDFGMSLRWCDELRSLGANDLLAGFS